MLSLAIPGRRCHMGFLGKLFASKLEGRGQRLSYFARPSHPPELRSKMLASVSMGGSLFNSERRSTPAAKIEERWTCGKRSTKKAQQQGQSPSTQATVEQEVVHVATVFCWMLLFSGAVPGTALRRLPSWHGAWLWPFACGWWVGNLTPHLQPAPLYLIRVSV